jgi:hypothetical protein
VKPRSRYLTAADVIGEGENVQSVDVENDTLQWTKRNVL